MLKKIHCLVYSHVEHVGYGFPFEANFKGLAVIAFAAAHLTWHKHIGQEVHFDGLVAVAFAFFATASRHIEREPSGLIAPYARFRQINKQASDV